MIFKNFLVASFRLAGIAHIIIWSYFILADGIDNGFVDICSIILTEIFSSDPVAGKYVLLINQWSRVYDRELQRQRSKSLQRHE
jgi:hypothetical protein